MDEEYAKLNQIIGERYWKKYEEIISNSERVTLLYDFIPKEQFYYTMSKMLNEISNIYNTDLQTIKDRIKETVESYWSEEYQILVLKYNFWGDILYQEIPKDAFYWPKEWDALRDQEYSKMQ